MGRSLGVWPGREEYSQAPPCPLSASLMLWCECFPLRGPSANQPSTDWNWTKSCGCWVFCSSSREVATAATEHMERFSVVLVICGLQIKTAVSCCFPSIRMAIIFLRYSQLWWQCRESGAPCFACWNVKCVVAEEKDLGIHPKFSQNGHTAQQSTSIYILGRTESHIVVPQYSWLYFS